MTQAAKKIPFEEYLDLDAEKWVHLNLPEGQCEYVDGELVELPPESLPNLRIANNLFLLMFLAGIPSNLIYANRCEIELLGKKRNRYPDLMVLREEHLALIQGRATITLAMPSPQLVAEVVSPGDDNQERDYTDKRQQYQKRGIPEYWLINPEYQTITVLGLKNEKYVEIGRFSGNTSINSLIFPHLGFTAEQVLTKDPIRF